MRWTEVIVIYDVGCPSCSRIARELPELVKVPVTVRSCRDPQLAAYPGLSAAVRACTTPALGMVRARGTVRWWLGLSGAVGVLPVVRPRALKEAVGLVWAAFRTARMHQ
ncbi:hypothetical protein [Pseudonocardia sp. TRM90224]|uniref:hypothetical protein n=1 Tax=Pseudonocardia sp. TRM90224 TaxID=2812678 RepID=UPI001E4F08D3|nr:hypothetical protein [Pseudonocardia sp. TRM90224]